MGVIEEGKESEQERVKENLRWWVKIEDRLAEMGQESEGVGMEERDKDTWQWSEKTIEQLQRT